MAEDLKEVAETQEAKKDPGYCKIALTTEKIVYFTNPNTGKELASYPAPRDTQVDGEQLGNAKFVVPAAWIKDIDPNHPKSRDYETPEFAEKHKYLIANRDSEITFKRSFKDEKAESGYGQFEKTITIRAYEKALKERNKRHQKQNDGQNKNKEVKAEAQENAAGGTPEHKPQEPAK